MSNREKKLAAALAAVRLYVQQDEEAAAAAAAEAALVLPDVRPVEPGQWAVSGRLEMMAARHMMQLRAIR